VVDERCPTEYVTAYVTCHALERTRKKLKKLYFITITHPVRLRGYRRAADNDIVINNARLTKIISKALRVCVIIIPAYCLPPVMLMQISALLFATGNTCGGTRGTYKQIDAK